MGLTIHPDPPPLRVDDTGTIRVGDTRLLLEMIVNAYRRGESPEAIAQAFPPTPLAEVYGVLAYYLRHQDELDAYLAERRRQADELRREIEERAGIGPGYRERLVARLAQRTTP